jgi:D-alanyl-lipoteichoic acid acyltransferase DltB (MBOAT superfamily)
MLFNSLHFLLFFPVVLGVHFLLPHRFRWIWQLLASCWFYMAFIPAYVLILFVLIAIDYVAGLAIEGSQGSRRKWFLVLSIVANVGFLGFFKYYNFFAANLTALSQALGMHAQVRGLEIVLPIGLSFHTFQSMAYTIEVYLGRQKAERHLGVYALYVLFWPQLVAGPIERPQNLLHQFKETRPFDRARAAEGAELMLFGFAKKVLVADTLARVVNVVYGDPSKFSGLGLLLGTYFFAFQIYCDFSGYSDIARGAAKILGFDLMVNFDRPYTSASISEFWRRWHISLSTWFRDYLYIPLGGSRGTLARTAVNLFIVFLVSGFWHGANWTFICWGAAHGTFLVAAVIFAGSTKKAGTSTILPHWLKVIITFHLATFAWVFFRAETVSKAVYVLGHMASKNGAATWSALPAPASQIGLCIFAIVALEIVDFFRTRRARTPQPTEPRGFFARSARFAFAAGVIILVLLQMTDDRGPQQFIYFQF